MIGFRGVTILSLSILALALTACETTTSPGSDESTPTFDQVQAIAKEQLTGEPCKFKVIEDFDDTFEHTEVDCLTSVGGQPQQTSVYSYDKTLEESDFPIGGLTTATHYFENGNITVDPAGGDLTSIQLDAEKFATAIKDECGCGEVKTPEK